MAVSDAGAGKNSQTVLFSSNGVMAVAGHTPALLAAEAWFDQQNWQAAESGFEQVFLADSSCVAAGLHWVRCALKQGKWLVAVSRVTELLRLHPTDYASWLEAAQLLAKLERQTPALNAFLQAVKLNPQRYEAHFGLVLLFENMGQKTVADNALVACLAVAEGGLSVSEYQQLADVRFRRGALASAVDAIYAAIRVAEATGQFSDKNARAELMLNAGVILTALGAYKAAEKAFLQALLSDSESILLALAAKGLSNKAVSFVALQRCIRLFPNSAAAYYCLAHLELCNRRVDEALAYLDQAEALDPQPVAAEMRIRAANHQGDQQAAHRFYLQQVQQGRAAEFRSKTCMTALYCDDLTATEVAQLHQRLCADLGKSARSAQSFQRSFQAERCLKLGIVTADFHSKHPVCQFMLPVLSRLDRAKLEVTVYYTAAQYDELTLQAKARVPCWRDVQHFSESQLAALIDDDQIDILLDLAGHTADQRMGLFGKRAAPVQVSFLGYPASTGVPNIDWMLVDKVVAPIGAEALFSERLWRLPNAVFCFAPEQTFSFPRYGQKQAKRILTFGSFNNAAKLTPLTIGLWAKILHALPEAQLLLKAPSFSSESALKTIAERFAAEGIVAERLVLRAPGPLSAMMTEYADVDIALDTLPYNGGTTTLQALWMGVPVVVKAGNNFVSRMGASFMQAAGLPEWVAIDDDDYVRIAVQMAQDRQALLKLKQGLRRSLLKKPAWDIDQYTRDFSDAIQGIWQEFVGRAG